MGRPVVVRAVESLSIVFKINTDVVPPLLYYMARKELMDIVYCLKRAGYRITMQRSVNERQYGSTYETSLVCTLRVGSGTEEAPIANFYVTDSAYYKFRKPLDIRIIRQITHELVVLPYFDRIMNNVKDVVPNVERLTRYVMAAYKLRWVGLDYTPRIDYKRTRNVEVEIEYILSLPFAKHIELSQEQYMKLIRWVTKHGRLLSDRNIVDTLLLFKHGEKTFATLKIEPEIVKPRKVKLRYVVSLEDEAIQELLSKAIEAL